MSTLLEALLPTSDMGHFSSLVFLGLCGVLTVIPGSIHHFRRDGGIESIAGLKLGAQRDVVIGVFGRLGATQIAWGLLMLAVVLHSPMLAPLLLLLIVLERNLLVFRWRARDAGVRHRPPEHYASLVLLPFGVLFLVLALTSNA